MDEHLRQLLDAIPERPPRSKLEPHAEVIRELRKKRRTYQEIADFFREHLQLAVAPSTIHDFVKTRARQARQKTAAMPELPPPARAANSTADSRPATQPASSFPASNHARERIRALRSKPNVSKSEPKLFDYDPQEPLILNSPKEEK